MHDRIDNAASPALKKDHQGLTVRKKKKRRSFLEQYILARLMPLGRCGNNPLKLTGNFSCFGSCPVSFLASFRKFRAVRKISLANRAINFAFRKLFNTNRSSHFIITQSLEKPLSYLTSHLFWTGKRIFYINLENQNLGARPTEVFIMEDSARYSFFAMRSEATRR